MSGFLGSDEKWKMSEKYLEAMVHMAPEQRIAYTKLCEDYRWTQINVGRHPFVSYTILAELIRWGWRR